MARKKAEKEVNKKKAENPNVISGVTTKEDYVSGLLGSGEILVKAGDRA